jgi:hypothetical protein
MQNFLLRSYLCSNLFLILFAGFFVAIFLAVPLAKSSCRTPAQDGQYFFVAPSVLKNTVLVYSGSRPTDYPGANMIEFGELRLRTSSGVVWRNLERSDVKPGEPMILFNDRYYFVAPAEMLRDAGTKMWRGTIDKTVTAPSETALTWLGSPTLVDRTCAP